MVGEGVQLGRPPHERPGRHQPVSSVGQKNRQSAGRLVEAGGEVVVALSGREGIALKLTPLVAELREGLASVQALDRQRRLFFTVIGQFTPPSAQPEGSIAASARRSKALAWVAKNYWNTKL